MEYKHLNGNGLKIGAAIEGEGPLIVLVHGWPESWYSWRHQIPFLASLGYKVAAIDVRGYGPVSYTHLRAHETREDRGCRRLR